MRLSFVIGGLPLLEIPGSKAKLESIGVKGWMS
jgi:hypothetical protein